MTAADTAVRFFHDVDRRDWAALRAAMTDELDVDYSSLSGGGPERLPAEDLLARWQGLLPGFDVTQHFLGPLTPAADDPGPGGVRKLECTVRGFHRLDGEEWMVAGSYDLTLRPVGDSWLVAGITLHVAYQTGDPGLPEKAAARIQEEGGGPDPAAGAAART